MNHKLPDCVYVGGRDRGATLGNCQIPQRASASPDHEFKPGVL